MLALLPTVPLGHQVWATVGLPPRYAPTPGTVMARLLRDPPEAVRWSG